MTKANRINKTLVMKEKRVYFWERYHRIPNKFELRLFNELFFNELLNKSEGWSA